jgi:hypothetical protein
MKVILLMTLFVFHVSAQTPPEKRGEAIKLAKEWSTLAVKSSKTKEEKERILKVENKLKELKAWGHYTPKSITEIDPDYQENTIEPGGVFTGLFDWIFGSKKENVNDNDRKSKPETNKNGSGKDNSGMTPE